MNGSHAQQLGVDPEILTAPAWALSAYLTDYKNFIPALRAPRVEISRIKGAYKVPFLLLTDQTILYMSINVELFSYINSIIFLFKCYNISK